MPNDRRRMVMVALTFNEKPAPGRTGGGVTGLDQYGCYDETSLCEMLCEAIHNDKGLASWFSCVEVVLLQDQGEV